MANVHPQCDLWLTAVSAEVTFADQQTYQDAFLELCSQPTLSFRSRKRFFSAPARSCCRCVSPYGSTWNIAPFRLGRQGRHPAEPPHALLENSGGLPFGWVAGGFRVLAKRSAII